MSANHVTTIPSTALEKLENLSSSLNKDSLLLQRGWTLVVSGGLRRPCDGGTTQMIYLTEAKALSLCLILLCTHIHLQ